MYLENGAITSLWCACFRDMLQSTDGFPLNFGFTGKGNSTRTDGLALGLEEQVKAGAIG